jgi:predicted transposase YbfD/YdcC
MGGQGERARQVVDPGGAAVLSLQENQPGLPRACAALFEGLRGPHPIDEGVVLGCDAQVEGGHGRREPRKGWRTEALAGVEAWERWPGLTTGVRVASTRERWDQTRRARRYSLRALPGTTDGEAKRLRRGMRTHWEMENRVHWGLDVAMGEDTKRTRAGESAQNLAIIRKLALHLWRRETTVPTGSAAKQKRAGWDHNSL